MSTPVKSRFNEHDLRPWPEERPDLARVARALKEKAEAGRRRYETKAEVERLKREVSTVKPEIPVRGERSALERVQSLLAGLTLTVQQKPIVDFIRRALDDELTRLPPDDPQPAPRSERPALERTRKAVRDVGIGLEDGRVHWSTVTAAIDAEIARQPPTSDLDAEIDELIQAVREQLMRHTFIDRERIARAINAIDAKRGEL